MVFYLKHFSKFCLYFSYGVGTYLKLGIIQKQKCQRFQKIFKPLEIFVHIIEMGDTYDKQNNRFRKMLGKI